MADLVAADEIEAIVGTHRHKWTHIGRLVSGPVRAFYILHSRDCFDSGRDLRECEYSTAMDRGFAVSFPEDRAVALAIYNGRLVQG